MLHVVVSDTYYLLLNWVSLCRVSWRRNLNAENLAQLKTHLIYVITQKRLKVEANSSDLHQGTWACCGRSFRWCWCPRIAQSPPSGRWEWSWPRWRPGGPASGLCRQWRLAETKVLPIEQSHLGNFQDREMVQKLSDLIDSFSQLLFKVGKEYRYFIISICITTYHHLQL